MLGGGETDVHRADALSWQERVRAAYGDAKYARLTDLKRRWDPGELRVGDALALL